MIKAWRGYAHQLPLGRWAKWVENKWNNSLVIAWSLVLAGIVLALGLACFPQSPGVSIGLLALVAGIMSVRTMGAYEKMAWVAVLIAFAILEVLAIGRSDETAKATREAQNKEFDRIVQKQDLQFRSTVKGLSDSYSLSQAQFDATMQKFAQTNMAEQRRFSALVKQDKELFAHEEELAESFSGKLVAGSVPTPANGCDGSSIPPNALLVLLANGNTAYGSRFPHSVFAVNGETLLKLVEISPGVIAPVMDIRGRDGKIIARFDESGFVIGNRLAVERPDASTLKVLDEYGDEAVSMHFLNPHAISISGFFFYRNVKVPIALPAMITNSCAGDNGVDFEINAKLR